MALLDQIAPDYSLCDKESAPSFKLASKDNRLRIAGGTYRLALR